MQLINRELVELVPTKITHPNMIVSVVQEGILQATKEEEER